MRNGFLGILLAVVAATNIYAAPVVKPAPTSQEVRNASGLQIEQDGQWKSPELAAQDSSSERDEARRNWFETASIEELTEYLQVLQERDRQWKEKMSARERERQRKNFSEADRESQEALRSLLETEQDLQNALIQQAVSASRFILPTPTSGSGATQTGPTNSQSNLPLPEKPVVDGEPYVDYVIDMPAAVTKKPKRKVKVKARRGVMELHQQIQDLNGILINDVVRMTGSPSE